MNIRSAFYKMARALGDVSAARRGRVKQRIGRRAVGKLLGQLLRALFPSKRRRR